MALACGRATLPSSTMIDLKRLRDDPDRFKRGAANKGSAVDIDALLDLDRQLRTCQTELQDLVAEKNRIGKEIGQVAGRMKKAADDAERAELQASMKALQQRPTAIKTREAELAARIVEIEPQRDALWLRIPQPADDDVPVGKSADDNVELRRWNPDWFDPAKSFEDNRGFAPLTHLELAEKHGLIEFQRAVKMSGSRSYVLIGDGMRLAQALLRFAFDFMTEENGFTPVYVPVIVRDEIMVGTGFFPEGRDQAYEIEETKRGGRA
ncbi:MAG: hypothetical protein HND57_12965 [Planctomycetes bacterium]|nr:hypothetical protein [Planctomycetota bacterium]